MTVPRRRRLTLLFVALLLVDLVCCGLLVGAIATGDELSRTGKLASAEVVDIDRETRRHVLVVQFLTVDRGQITAGTTRYHKFDKEVGRTVLVRYDTNQPLRFQTVDWKPNRTPHWILLIVLATGAVLLVMRLARKVARQPAAAAKGEWPEDGAGMR